MDSSGSPTSSTSPHPSPKRSLAPSWPRELAAYEKHLLIPLLSNTVLVVSKVVRWIITPEQIDVKPLLHPPKPWDLLVIVVGTDALPKSLTQHIYHSWTTTAGIPSRLTNSFASTNAKLLHPEEPSAVPPLTGALHKPRLGSSSQTLELSTSLQSWVKSFSQSHAGGNAVSMLNLLSFNPDMHDSYLTYGKAFSESIGSKRGGNAKLVGNIVIRPEDQGTSDDGGGGGFKWDEFALAHYPSILHFADMLASEDYQAVNLKYRVPALRDTCILCTSEIQVEEILARQEGIGREQRAGEKRDVKL